MKTKAFCLIFCAVMLVSCAGDQLADQIAGREWLLVEIDGSRDLAGDVTLNFNETASAVSGRAACNSYSGEVILKGERIEVGMLVGTLMGCDQPRMDLEFDFLNALGSASRINLEGNTLTIYTDEGDLIFTQQ